MVEIENGQYWPSEPERTALDLPLACVRLERVADYVGLLANRLRVECDSAEVVNDEISSRLRIAEEVDLAIFRAQFQSQKRA